MDHLDCLAQTCAFACGAVARVERQHLTATKVGDVADR